MPAQRNTARTQVPVDTSPRIVKLEFNNSGAWKYLGEFDLVDDETTGYILDSAENLVKHLHGDKPPKRCPTMRLSQPTAGDSTTTVVARWDIQAGWRDPIGNPF